MPASAGREVARARSKHLLKERGHWPGQELSAPWTAERGPSPLPTPPSPPPTEPAHLGELLGPSPSHLGELLGSSPLALPCVQPTALGPEPKKVALIQDPLRGPASALDPPGTFAAPAPEGSTADLPFVTPGQDCSLTDPCTRVTLSQLARAGKASLALSEGPHRAEYTGAREGATEVTLSSRGLGNSEQGDEPPSA